MNCQSLYLIRAELEANPVPRFQQHHHQPPRQPVSHHPLSQAPQLRNRESNWSLLDTLHAAAQIHGKHVHQDPVLSYDRWVELQNHIATGDL